MFSSLIEMQSVIADRANKIIHCKAAEKTVVRKRMQLNACSYPIFSRLHLDPREVLHAVCFFLCLPYLLLKVDIKED